MPIFEFSALMVESYLRFFFGVAAFFNGFVFSSPASISISKIAIDDFKSPF